MCHHESPEVSPNRRGICDTGYGNSAIDNTHAASLEKQGLARNQRTLASPRKVRGLGSGIAAVQELIDVPIFLPSKNGQTAHFIRSFHIFENLGTPILLGGDILQAERIDMLYSDKMVINSFGKLQVKTYATQSPRRRLRFVRASNNTLVPGSSVLPVLICPLQVGSKADFRVSPASKITTTGYTSPHRIISGDTSRLLVTNLLDHPIRIHPRTILAIAEQLDQSYVGCLFTIPAYQPQYQYPLLEGIKIGTEETCMVHEVDVNPELPPDDAQALKNLAERYRVLFNSVRGLVREDPRIG